MRGNFHTPGLAVHRGLDNVGHVLGLIVDHVREIDRKARLRVLEHEHVRKTWNMHAVQRLNAAVPDFGQSPATHTKKLIAGAARVLRAHSKPVA